MKVTGGLLWSLCTITVLGLPALLFAAFWWELGDAQQMFPGAVLLMLLWLLVLAPLTILSTARSADNVGEGISWLAWRRDCPLSSGVRTVTLGGAGLLAAWAAWHVSHDTAHHRGDLPSAAYLTAVALWFFALRAAAVATAPIILRRRRLN